MKEIEKAYKIIEEALNEIDLAALKPEDSRLELNITGEDGGTINLKISQNNAVLSRGKDPEADCKISISGGDFEGLISGKINPLIAIITGKIQIKGDKAKAKRLIKLFI